jgi:L-lysine 2,3-aminomutase
MIPKPDTPRQTPAWQKSLLDGYAQPQALLQALGIAPEDAPLAAQGLRDFPLRVPRSYVARMRRGDPRDPLFLQVWPQAAEDQADRSLPTDAVGDLARSRGGGLIHKYQGRALLMTTGACAVHCRYCFRRHFPYSDHLAAREQWRPALDLIREDRSLEEIILSGGDPLSLSDTKLAVLVEALDAIPHLQRLRLHTRQPVVLPERVDEALLAWLGRTRLQTVIVLHINHAQEIDAALAAALRRLRATGAQLLNQSVLLRGVNDKLTTLKELSEKLFANGVLPYYLHLMDQVPGVMHYDVSEREGVSLMTELSAQLPGYLVPRLVREIAGQPAKTLVTRPASP